MAVTDEKLIYLGAQEGFARVNRSEPVGRLTKADIAHAKDKDYYHTEEFQRLSQRSKLNGWQSRVDGAVHFDQDIESLLKIVTEISNFMFPRERTGKNYYSDECLKLVRDIVSLDDSGWQIKPERHDYWGLDISEHPQEALTSMGLYILFDYQRRYGGLHSAISLVDFMDEKYKKGFNYPRNGICQHYYQSYSTSYNSLMNNRRYSYPLDWVKVGDAVDLLCYLKDKKSYLYSMAIMDAEKLASSCPSVEGEVYQFLLNVKDESNEAMVAFKGVNKIRLKELGDLEGERKALSDKSRDIHLKWRGLKP